MWIESVLGHSFMACNLLWPCSLIETSDRVKWDSRFRVSKSRVSHWSGGEKQRRWRDTTRCAPLSCYVTNKLTNSSLVPCTHPNKKKKKKYKNPDRDLHPPARLGRDIGGRLGASRLYGDDSIRNLLLSLQGIQMWAILGLAKVSIFACGGRNIFRASLSIDSQANFVRSDA